MPTGIMQFQRKYPQHYCSTLFLSTIPFVASLTANGIRLYITPEQVKPKVRLVARYHHQQEPRATPYWSAIHPHDDGSRVAWFPVLR